MFEFRWIARLFYYWHKHCGLHKLATAMAPVKHIT